MGIEDQQLNYPGKNFFERKKKCVFASSEFRFAGGKLDLLAYNRDEKSFYVAEGKYAKRIASVGHAVGQLIAYISMLQENGYDFLDNISKAANLHLTDFSQFLENRAIKVRFYVILPIKFKEKLIEPATLMLKNIGDFGDSIGIIFAKKARCIEQKEARPISIRIRKKYDKKQLIDAIEDKIISSELGNKLDIWQKRAHLISFKEIDGNSRLHFEVHLRKRKRGSITKPCEIGFHLEWGKGWLKDKRTRKRANKIKRQMYLAKRALNDQGLEFKYTDKWGKSWTKVYSQIDLVPNQIDSDDLDNILKNLKPLVEEIMTRMRKINWGRTRKKENAG